MDDLFESIGSTFGETKDKNTLNFSNNFLNNTSTKNDNNIYNSFSFNKKKNNTQKLLKSSPGLNIMRPYSNNKIRKTILNFNKENQNYKKFPMEFLSKEENFNKIKFEKLTPSSKKIESYKKNIQNDLSIFKNYKPMKRYFISNLKNVPSLYDNNGRFNAKEKKSLILSENQKLKLNESNDFNTFKVFH